MICKQIANALGGDLTVSSELGRGTSFTLSLDCKFKVDNKFYENLLSSLDFVKSIEQDESKVSKNH